MQPFFYTVCHFLQQTRWNVICAETDKNSYMTYCSRETEQRSAVILTQWSYKISYMWIPYVTAAALSKRSIETMFELIVFDFKS